MRTKLILIIISGLLLCCTCCNTSTDFNNIEESIRNQIYPADMNKDFKFSLGARSMHVINGFIDDKEEAEVCLKEINSVQVGIYKISNADISKSFRIPHKVEKCMVEKGWEPFVHVRKNKGENVSLYYRQLSENTASIYAIVLEPDELVIAEINGNLEKIMNKAICEHRLPGMNQL